MKKTLLVILLTFFSFCLSFTSIAQTTGYSGTGSNIDVIYQKCEWIINPVVSKNISGTVTIQFKTLVANVSSVSFDLNKGSFSNASLTVKYLGNDVPFSFPTTGNVNILNITLPAALAINTTASVVITYSGIPPNANSQAIGFQTGSDGMGDPYIYTLSESYEDRDWWPCKADMQDKIDQMDIWVTVPNGYRAATNGAFVDSNTVVGGQRTFKYQTKYPIATYLVALGVAKYIVYNRTPVTIGGVSVPVWYWILPGKTSARYTTIQNTLDKSRTQLVNFSNKFGDYPFKNEKHGFYEFGWGGGMEHQSFSAMSNSALTDWSTTAHEVAHQWFGNQVTFASWNELWLAEGFARYSEALTLELDPTVSTTPGETPATVRQAFKDAARTTTSTAPAIPMSRTEVYIPNANITNSNALWGSTYGSSVYEKGAMVVSMLRKLVGDAQFFQATRNYLADVNLQYKSARTADLKSHFEAVCGYDLDPFFNDWVYGKGHADYTMRWNNAGQRLAIQVGTQTRSTGTTVSYFRSPLVVYISNGLTGASLKDTTVVIYDQNGSLSYAGNGINPARTTNTLAYQLSFTPTTVSFDSKAETMLILSGTFTKDATINPAAYTVLPINVIDFKATAGSVANQLQLKLTTTSSDIKLFAERSLNGNDYKAIGTLNEKEGNGSSISYTFSDADVADGGKYWYRVRMIDEEGKVEYTKAALVERRGHGLSLLLHPNPAQKIVHVGLPGPNTSKIRSCAVYNAAGACVQRTQDANSNNLNLDVSSLPSGSYTISVFDTKNNTWPARFTVTR